MQIFYVHLSNARYKSFVKNLALELMLGKVSVETYDSSGAKTYIVILVAVLEGVTYSKLTSSPSRLVNHSSRLPISEFFFEQHSTDISHEGS